MEQKPDNDDAMDGDIELHVPNGVGENVGAGVAQTNGHAGSNGDVAKAESSETGECETSNDIDSDADLRKRHSILEILQVMVSRGATETEEKWRPYKDIRMFIFFFWVVNLAIGSGFVQVSVSENTLEKRFGLTNKESNWINSSDDIAAICVVLFVGFFGQKVNKARLLAALSLIGGIGLLLFVFPYRLYPREERGVTQKLPTLPSMCYPAGIPDDMAGMLGVMLNGKLNGTPGALLPVEMPEGMPDGLPNGTFGGIPEGIPEGTLDGIPNGTSEGIPEGISEGIPGGIPNGTSRGMPNSIPSGIPDNMPIGMPNGTNGIPAGLSNTPPSGMLGGLQISTLPSGMLGLDKIPSGISDKVGACPGDDYNENAYGFFVAGSVLTGIAQAGHLILAFCYIDENSSKKNSPLCIGIAATALPMASLVGFGLGTVLLDEPENFKAESFITNSDLNFIGCWWLPFLIYGVVTILFSIPMFFFPKHMGQYNINKLETLQVTSAYEEGPNDGDKGSIKGKLSEFVHDLWRVLRNGTFMILTLSATCLPFLLVSYIKEVPEYLFYHFNYSSTKATELAGGVTVPAQVIGAVMAGYILKRFDLGSKGGSRMLLITFILVLVGIGGTYPWDCKHSQVQKTIDQCNENCGCSMDSTLPVCGDDLVLFPFACHAGCTIALLNKTVSHCSCSQSTVPLSFGRCEMEECDHIGFYILFFLASLFYSAARVTAIPLQLRIIGDGLRSVGLGTAAFLYCAVAYIPGPIIMRELLNSFCLVWLTTCGERSDCVAHNMDDYRNYMHGVTLGVVGFGTLLAIPMNLLVARRVNKEEDKTVMVKGMNGVPERNGVTPVYVNNSFKDEKMEDSASIETP